MSPEQRSAVVAEALTWLRTPYAHAQDVKGVGVDCVMLLVRAFCDTGVLPRMDPRPYSRQWFLHRSEEFYLGGLIEHGCEIDEARAKPGDIVIYRFGRCFAHAAIIVDWPTIVHAFAPAKCVTLGEGTSGQLADPRPRRFFSLATVLMMEDEDHFADAGKMITRHPVDQVDQRDHMDWERPG